MNVPQFTTLDEALHFAEAAFLKADLHYGHGADNAWDEAVYLALPTLGLPIDADKSVLQHQLSENEKRRLAYLFQTRINTRKPAAYLVNKAWFAGLEFYVDERVLVPRSPLAELIEAQFQPWIDADAIKSILEIGAGSGCIAIACAHYLKSAKVDAIDIDAGALAVAKTNIEQHQCANQVSLYQSDVFDALPKKKYDVIISNPPYVDAKDMATLPAEYQHEPSLGLKAGDDGLDIVKCILAQAKQYLTEQGVLIIEVGNSAPTLEAVYPHLPFTWLEFERGGEGVFLLHAKDLVTV